MATVPKKQLKPLESKLKLNFPDNGDRYPAYAVPYVVRNGNRFLLVKGGEKKEVEIGYGIQWGDFHVVVRLLEVLPDPS